MNDSASLPIPGPGSVGLVEHKDFLCPERFVCENGEALEEISLRYETYGRLNTRRDNAILVCHALSGDHHAAGIYRPNDRKPGWWDNLIGPDKAVDTNKYFVISSNCLGGCQGSTGPSSINPRTGKAYALDFPFVTIKDMVRAQRRLIDHLGIEQLACVMGGSMGGMQVLEWMIEYPDRVRNALPLATTARQSAQAIAFNEVGRHAIMQDPEWHHGDYLPQHGPNTGLAVARMMAHITYLSDAGLERKFGRKIQRAVGRGLELPDKGEDSFDVHFQVESYLRYQGRSFVNRFDANTYLYFTRALDRFDLYEPTGKLEDSFRSVQARVMCVGFSSDWLFPPTQNREIVHALLRAGKHATYAEVEMEFGHDSFLVEAPELYDLIRAFLAADYRTN